MFTDVLTGKVAITHFIDSADTRHNVFLNGCASLLIRDYNNDLRRQITDSRATFCLCPALILGDLEISQLMSLDVTVAGVILL